MTLVLWMQFIFDFRYTIKHQPLNDKIQSVPFHPTNSADSCSISSVFVAWIFFQDIISATDSKHRSRPPLRSACELSSFAAIHLRKFRKWCAQYSSQSWKFASWSRHFHSSLDILSSWWTTSFGKLELLMLYNIWLFCARSFIVNWWLHATFQFQVKTREWLMENDPVGRWNSSRYWGCCRDAMASKENQAGKSGTKGKVLFSKEDIRWVNWNYKERKLFKLTTVFTMSCILHEIHVGRFITNKACWDHQLAFAHRWREKLQFFRSKLSVILMHHFSLISTA